MPTPDEALDKAFQDTVSAIAPEMPYLMHGAGDVTPVNPATAQLVAALTVQYMGKLVDAAIDAHEMLSETTHPLPPPAFSRSRQPPKPFPPAADDTKTAGVSAKVASPKKRRARDEFWDEPLPEPKIRNKNKSTSESVRQQVDNTTAREPVHVDEWVGLAGVDLLENRSRSAYVQGPAVMTPQSFLFPICHDVYTYGRVIEMQASKRSLGSLLIDPVVTDLVRVEGRQEHHHHHHKKKSESGTASDPEEADEEASNEEDEKEMPYWPGLDDILPSRQSTKED